MKAGFVGLIGLPNAGKSTFLNWFVNEKLSIVTAKPQTTRRRVIGLVTVDQGQVVFVDSPGKVDKEDGFFQYLKKEAISVAENSDALICFLNLDEDKKENLENLLTWVASFKKEFIIVVTKTDLESKAHRLAMMSDLIKSKANPRKIFFINNKKWNDEDKKEILQACLEMLPQSIAPLYDPELYTPHTLKEIAPEVIRETCLEQLQKEIPFRMAVQIIKFDDSDPGLYKIYAELLVSKESHKPIVIGKSGSMIKEIGTQSRKKLESAFAVKIFLDLKVTVKQDWDLNPRIMKELGYVHDNE